MQFGGRRVGGLMGALVALTTLAVLSVLATPAAARPRSANPAWVDLGPGQAYGINDQLRTRTQEAGLDG